LIVKETKKVVKALLEIKIINWSKIVHMLRKLWFNLAYLQTPVWDTGISPPELLVFITTHEPGRALDLGCGTGTNVITLAKHGWEVIGVDFAKRAISLAKKKAQQYGVDVDLHLEDVTRLDSIKGRFDLILDVGCFHSLPASKRTAYILKIDQLLNDTGTYLLYLFFMSPPDGFAPGVSEDDIHIITQTLQVVERKDSTERGIRPSAWFALQRNR
jgi:2-polyprenyl-3-methyl-5-hydroxy-6-metoxy-1,4-benzoquinol methylase